MSLEQQRGEFSFSCSFHSLCSSKRATMEPDLETRRATVRLWGKIPLPVADQAVHESLKKERQRQRQIKEIELFSWENYVYQAVLHALGIHLTNKYSEGTPGPSYYGGNQYIDNIERLLCDRALAAFNLDPECWGVSVQAYSCTLANFVVYTGLLLPKDRIMGLDSFSGGHVSHEYLTPSGKRISGVSLYFESLSYKLNPKTRLIDYDQFDKRVLDFHRTILICGAISYPREWDYARFRKIADKFGALQMCVMAHISGLVAAKILLTADNSHTVEFFKQTPNSK